MNDVRNYAVVSASYWGFTLTDGALRMLVLLHFHGLGYSPLDLAFLFLLYEAMGIITNFVGGWIGARFGLRITLYGGLSVQIVALILLSFLQDHWAIGFSVIYVMLTQALSGVAKDLTKMSSKSAIKVVVKEEGRLFKWVALLTGSKNALKGAGFFMGGALLQGFGFVHSLWIMAAGLFVVLVFSFLSIRGEIGKAKSKIQARELFSKSREINILSFARVFLFAARDVWFVVGLPIFFASQLGWQSHEIGTFMASWVIGYGIIQASVPGFLPKTQNARAGARQAGIWGFILVVLTTALAFATVYATEHIAIILIAGLMVFALVFAVNSAVHSYLIVAYSDDDKVSLSVGFYYMANACGRLLGTLLSGLVYQAAGLEACLAVSALMVLIASVSVTFLNKKETVQAGS